MSDKPDLEQVVRKLHSDGEQMLKVVMGLVQDVAARGLQADRLEAAVSRLETGQTDASDRLNRLEAGQERLEAGQKALRTDFLDEMGRTRADIMEKIGGLQGDVTRIRDDISVNMGGVDAARKANDNTREDMIQMREQISVMWKQLKQAQDDIRTLKDEP